MIPLPETSYSLASEGDGYSLDRIWREEGYTAEQMHAYAAAAVAAERERCAKLCDYQAQLQIDTGADDGVIAQAKRCAMLIRRA